MSSSDDVDRVLAVVSDLKHATKRLDVKMAMEFFERSSPPLVPLRPPLAAPVPGTLNIAYLYIQPHAASD
jgi:hypothetical protein